MDSMNVLGKFATARNERFIMADSCLTKNEIIVKLKHKYKVGDIVLISENIKHDLGYKRQVGVVYKSVGYFEGDFYYYVVSYNTNANRYWCCGFYQNELETLEGDLVGLVNAYACWLSDNCSDYSIFNSFMKSLKRIRKNIKHKLKSVTNCKRFL